MKTTSSIVSQPDCTCHPYISPLSLSSPETSGVEVSNLANQQGWWDDTEGSYFELLFLEAGEGWCYLGDRPIQAVAGDLFLVAPSEGRDFTGLNQTKHWRIAFATDLLAPSQSEDDSLLRVLEELLLLSFLRAREVETSHFRVAAEDCPKWLERLKQLEWELCSRPVGFAEAASTLLMLLLIDTARLAAPQWSGDALPSHSLLISVFRFIESHYRHQISLCDVAKAVNRSPAYLTNLVHRKTGRTILNWIVERRIREARRLLLVSERPVSQIAEEVGYLDTGHFIRQFSRFHGMTPQAWRHAHRN